MNQERIEKIKRAIAGQKAAKKTSPEIWEGFKRKHFEKTQTLTYEDLVWIGYYLGYKYQWSMYAAVNIGLYSDDKPIVIIPRQAQKVLPQYKILLF